MVAVATLPSLSQLLDWPTQHLTDAAEDWEVVAERNYGLANQVWRDASSVDWQGHAADALRTATHSDMIAASAAADQLQAAAKLPAAAPRTYLLPDLGWSTHSKTRTPLDSTWMKKGQFSIGPRADRPLNALRAKPRR